MKRFRPTIREIQSAVATHYGISAAQLRSSARRRRVSHPRQMAMYLARDLTDRTLAEIGRMFGGRNHTTVLFAVRAVRDRLDEDLWLHVERQSVLHWLRQARAENASKSVAA